MAVIADTSFKSATYPKSLARRLGLTGFWHWWKQELAAATPARARAALERRRATPVLAFDGSRATLWQPSANGAMRMVAVADVPLYADEESVAAAGRAALAPLVAANGSPPRIVIALSPRASLRKTLTLPAALEDHLHQSLAYDLDRHTPFKPEDLYFDAVVVDRDIAHNALRVELAAAKRALVDTAIRQAEGFGARVVGVVVDPPAVASSSRINLLPEDRRPGASGWARWQIVVPAAVLALGILAALFLPIWQKRSEAIALLDLAGQAHERAAVSERLRAELERRVGEYNFALERKYAFPGTVQVLDDITRILPDDTWLTQMEIHTLRGKDAEREATLRGESANAGRLVALLEDSKLFTQTAPRSPTTKIQPGPGEIFDVSTHIKPLPAPTALPVEMTPPMRPAASATPPAPIPPSATAPAVPRPVSPSAAGAAPKASAPAADAHATPTLAPPAPQPTRTPGSFPPGTGGASRPPARVGNESSAAPESPAPVPSDAPTLPETEDDGG